MSAATGSRCAREARGKHETCPQGAMTDRQRLRAAPTASQTTTQTNAQPGLRTETPRTLRLRGANQGERRSVQWAEDVVDNEGLGRKSSKGWYRGHYLRVRADGC